MSATPRNAGLCRRLLGPVANGGIISRHTSRGPRLFRAGDWTTLDDGWMIVRAGYLSLRCAEGLYAARYGACAREEAREATMLVPFGTHVVDRDGKSVGTVSRLILHPQSQQVVA